MLRIIGAYKGYIRAYKRKNQGEGEKGGFSTKKTR
jgi:hypothetical protein